MRRFFISKRETKKLLEELKRIGFEGEIKEGIERVEGEVEVFLWNGKPLCFVRDGKYYPALHHIHLFKLKKVVVDMGAVPHIAGGANVMAPGIVEMEDLREGEMVVVVDERHAKPIAVGVSVVSGGKPEKGVVVKNIHHVGDRIWRLG